MPGLHLYRSNRIELLARMLGAVIRDKLPRDPFAPVSIVVGSQGMERWLRHELARSLSICANMEFPFPATRVDGLIASVLGEQAKSDASPWGVEALTWAVLELLPELLSTAGFDLVAEYLGKGTAPGMAASAKDFGLAQKLADLFDRYVTYRPELVRSWSGGERVSMPKGAEALAWQQLLFRRLAEHLDGRPHRALRMAEAEAKLRGGLGAGTLTGPLLIFGVSSLPPAWMTLLGLAAKELDVDMFLLCPSNEYWGELRRAAPSNPARSNSGTPPEMLTAAPETSLHPLLASLGRVARDFQFVVEAHSEGYVDAAVDAFPDPVVADGPTALRILQSDILSAIAAPIVSGAPERALEPRDDSLQFHDCYGPMRQVEALRDVLLGLFEDHRDLEPRDVLVITPDIEAYAPLVTAVFSQGSSERRERHGVPIEGPDGWGPTGAPQMPFTIVDRSVRRENPVAEALLRVLELATGRLEASRVLDLFTLEPVQRKLGVTSSEVPLLQRWVRESGIRWARDGAHRAAHGLPQDGQNTWEFGLRRLLLGVVMADDGRMLEAVGAADEEALPIRPFDDIEGGETVLLGRLVEFCDALFETVASLAEPRPVVAWVAALGAVVERLTDASSAPWRALRVREILGEFALGAEQARSTRPVELDAIRAALAARFDMTSRATNEQSGAVTFAAMRPMRSVPYPVVALLGMDEGAFPRNSGAAAFDLLQLAPRVGDASPRDEDRYLLLEAILAARRNLLVFYTGRDPSSGAPRAPCVPIGELRDVVDGRFVAPSGSRSPSAWMTTEHPLQAFSRSAFLPPVSSTDAAAGRRWSFDRRLCLAAEARHRKVVEGPFLVPMAGHRADDEAPIPLGELVRFFKHPTQQLLQRGLRIDLGDDEELVPDREPVELEGLDRYALRKGLLEERLGGGAQAGRARRLHAAGAIPLGSAGDAAVDEEAQLVDAMLERAFDRVAKTTPETLVVDLSALESRLTGTLGPIYGDTLLCLEFGQESAAKVASAWLALLALGAAGHPVERAALVLGNRKKGKPEATGLVFEAPENARELLVDLVAVYRRGMAEPLPLFPHASWAFAWALRDHPDAQQALEAWPPTNAALEDALRIAHEKALEAWFPRPYARSDGDDRYIARVFDGDVPLSDRTVEPLGLDLEFARLAVRVWGPALAHRSTWSRGKKSERRGRR